LNHYEVEGTNFNFAYLLNLHEPKQTTMIKTALKGSSLRQKKRSRLIEPNGNSPGNPISLRPILKQQFLLYPWTKDTVQYQSR